VTRERGSLIKSVPQGGGEVLGLLQLDPQVVELLGDDSLVATAWSAYSLYHRR